MGFVEDLREAVRASGRPQQELADEIGVNLISLNRFVNGRRGISVETAEKLAKVLGREIKLDEKKPKGKRK
jgi:plasmid maintenance system antidote protein VapI